MRAEVVKAAKELIKTNNTLIDNLKNKTPLFRKNDSKRLLQ
jgi:hypothetical protein